MPTIDPSDECCQAIVDRINAGSGGTYTLPTPATYVSQIDEDGKDVNGLEVTVVHLTEKELDETLDVEQRTSHELRVWIRQRTSDKSNSAVAAVKLIGTRIKLWIKDFRTSRVCVWECNTEPEEQPEKNVLRQHGVTSKSIYLRVEVEP